MSERVGALLAVHRLSVSYGKIPAVVDASFEVRSGEVVALIGPNSAGKSSLVTALAMRSRGMSVTGTADLDGRSLTRLETRGRRRSGVRIVPEFRGVLPGLTVLDNLRLAADIFGLSWGETLAAARDLFPEVFVDRASSLAGNLSGGEQQMLALARALAGEPRILFLDEPRLGLSANVANRLKESVNRVSEAGVAVVLADQTLGLWASACDTVHTLVRGRLSPPIRGREEITALASRVVIE